MLVLADKSNFSSMPETPIGKHYYRHLGVFFKSPRATVPFTPFLSNK